MTANGQADSASVLVLCPMRIERDAVERALREAGLGHVRVLQTGIGKDAIIAALIREARADGRNGVSLAILAGACGGLVAVDHVPPIARIIDTRGNSWTPAGAETLGEDAVTLIAVDRIVSTPEDKRQLAAQTGAAIVDMESHAFAAECERLGIRWAVVRGVSDTPDESLPHEVLDWITPSGDTRNRRAVMDMVRRPRLIPHIAGVLRRSRRVLPLVGREVARLARAEVSGAAAGSEGARA